MIRHSQSTQSNKFAIYLQYLKKEFRKGVHFLHADEHQSFYKLGLLFLMEVARYVQSTQNKEFGIVLQRVLQLLLCSIVMQNIQIFHGVQPCLLLLLFLHSQTVEMFCLNTAIQYLDSIYVGRDCHLCCPGSKLTFFKRTRVYCCKSSYAHQTSQKKLVSGLVIQILSPEVLQESIIILQLKVYIIYVVKKIVGQQP